MAQGVRDVQIVLVGTLGVVHGGRETSTNSYQARFATDEPCRTLAGTMRGADALRSDPLLL